MDCAPSFDMRTMTQWLSTVYQYSTEHGPWNLFCSDTDKQTNAMLTQLKWPTNKHSCRYLHMFFDYLSFTSMALHHYIIQIS